MSGEIRMSVDKSLNTALQLYIGYKVIAWPQEEGSRLLAEFGPELGSQFEADAKQLLAELGQLNADWKNHTLVSGAKWAAGEMSRRHPELDAEAIAALAWIYSWWWK
jgi:hypothetical protein